MARYGHRTTSRAEPVRVGDVYRKLSPHQGFMVLIKVSEGAAFYVTIDENGQVLSAGRSRLWDFQHREVEGYVTDTRWSTSNNQLEIIWRAK
jgi:hypothetical protein